MKRNAKVLLDRHLKVLVLSLRCKGKIVAIEFTHKGKRWRADTTEEAIALREKLEAEDKEQEKYLSPEELDEQLLRETKWTPDRFVALVENVGPMQKKFLTVLLNAEHSIGAEEARKKTGVPSLMSLAGVQSRLAKEVRAIGLEPVDLYQVHIDWTEGERRRFFTLDKGFRMVAREEGWPE